MQVPTPTEGHQTQRVRKPVPDSVKVALPMSAIGALAMVAIGWVWNTDKAQALDHQAQEALKVDHDSFKSDVKSDMKEVQRKLDDLRDLVLRLKP